MALTEYFSRHSTRVSVRDTTACFLPRLNASNASKSLHQAVPGVLEFQLTCEHLYPLYTIVDLFTGVDLSIVTRDNKHKKLARLLQRQILDPTCDIDTDVSMGDAAKTSLISSGLQKPDVVLFTIVNGLRHPVVLIEVESNSDVLSTSNKLANGIMYQIIYLRNTEQTISTLKGFFVPVRDGNAEEITVKFDENNLQFDCERIPVTVTICNLLILFVSSTTLRSHASFSNCPNQVQRPSPSEKCTTL